MICRRMQTEELNATITLFRYYAGEAHKFNEELGDEFDENSVIESIRARNIHPEYIWFNLYDNNRPVGFVSACITQAPWNKEIHYAHIEMIFILESHRNMDNFKMLLKNVEEWARMFGAQKITGGDIGINPDRTKKVYNHLGFDESCFMSKELEYV